MHLISLIVSLYTVSFINVKNIQMKVNVQQAHALSLSLSRYLFLLCSIKWSMTDSSLVT